MTSAHRSPPGTYERIRKSVLEDPDLSDAEFRAIGYLAAKPPGWIVHPGTMAAELRRSPSWSRRALTALRKRGLVITEEDRKTGGAFTSRVSRLVRSLIIADETAGQNQRAESGTVAATCDDTENRRSEPARRFTTRGETARLETTETPREKDLREKAECPDCHGKFNVRADGRLQVHGPPSHRCIGSGFVIDEHAWANRRYQGLPCRPGELVHAVSHHDGAVTRDELARLLCISPRDVSLVAAIALKNGHVDVIPADGTGRDGGGWVVTPGRRGMPQRRVADVADPDPIEPSTTAPCPICGRETKLKPNGVLWPHGDRYNPCLGSETQPALPASAVAASAAIGQILAADPGIISPPAAVNGHGTDTCPECGQPAERYKTGRMKPHADRTGCKCSLSDRFVSTA